VPVDWAEATAGMKMAVEQRRTANFFTESTPRLSKNLNGMPGGYSGQKALL
jgi:hypothetical protein